MNLQKFPPQQRSALFYVRQHQTAEYGVIVRAVTARALIDRGYAVEAERRGFARREGVCIRLTETGLDVCRMVEGEIALPQAAKRATS
jgi:hypothetical protein